jgi:cytoskeletal protein RodZ
MLAYILALVIGLGSLAMYLAAFFFPEVHRKEDFIWSGVGLFYALVLWVCAGRITGGVLLGQMASVALLGWLGWQTLTLRRELALPEQKTQISPDVQEKLKGFSVAGIGQTLQQQVNNLFKKKPSQAKTPTTAQPSVKTVPDKQVAPIESVAPVEVATSNVAKATAPSTPVTTTVQAQATPDAITRETQVDTPATDTTETSESPELVRPNPPTPDLVEAAQNPLSDTPEAAIPVVEEIAPDAELAPPAEPPGDGDPQMRQTPPEP